MQIMIPPILEMRTAPRSLGPETRFLVAAHGSQVEIKDLQLDAIEVQLVKCIAHCHSSGIDTQTQAPQRPLTEHDAKRGRAVRPVDTVQPDVADVHPRPLDAGFDRKDTVIPSPLKCLEPSFLLCRRHGCVHEKILDHLGIVEPAHKGGNARARRLSAGSALRTAYSFVSIAYRPGMSFDESLGLDATAEPCGKPAAS